MTNFTQILAVVGAGVAVGLSDAIIKKIAVAENFWLAFKNPWMIIVALFYFLQIALFIYAFTHHWKLGIAGNLQMIFYSITMVLIGFFLFKENLSLIQMVGIGLSIVAIFLINHS